MQTVTTDPLVGRLLEGRYRIVDRIARGGMSTVYAAVDTRLDRRVAVKVMSSALSADPKFSDRFAREARAAARLTHVNAVAVYDQGQDDTAGHHVFLVMELVDGRTLRDLIRERGGRFTPAEAVSIMEPVLSALSAAHRAGLVHHDVKPENILISDDGLVKVADFGLARATDADPSSTRTGLMMGTVAYCSPEQIVHGRSDQRSDVYAAGIVLFELLTGRPPYQGESAMNVAYQHVHSRVPAPSSRVKGIPTPIDEIVVAATDSDPTGRPPDAPTLLAELADARAELALPVVPVPPRARPVSRPGTWPGTHGRPSPAPNGNGTARPHGAPPHRSRTAPVPGTTEVIGAGDARRGGTNDTRQVPRRGDASGPGAPGPSRAPAGPPPPIVIPPPRTASMSPRARRRRRRIVMLVAVLLLGAASVTGGIVGVRLFREWNTKVPDVGGVPAAGAQAQLQEVGYALDPHPQSEFSETVPKGNVIRTDPDAGSRLAQGKAVRLIVSLGQDRVTVPDVHGQSVTTAEQLLQARGIGFDPVTTVRSSIKVPQGTVIATDPKAGTKVKRSQQVTIVESGGPPDVTIPTFGANTSYEDVSAALTKAKFVVEKVEDYSDDVPQGDVILISPTGRARYGSTITVDVSKGRQLVAVPSYSSLHSTLDEYEPQLDTLGLTYDVRALLGGQEGVIVRVNPEAGTLVAPGTSVTIYVV